MRDGTQHRAGLSDHADRAGRPEGAPRGAIRAHLATFTSRATIMRRALRAILPQVDHLYIVLNGYDAVPDDIAAEPRITAIVPPRDVRDAGKFWFTPEPDDIVFLIDDDLIYPPDYVARSIEAASRVGWDAAAFGYMADTRCPDAGVRHYRMRDPVDQVMGARLLGTGTTLLRGDNLPPLSVIEPGHGYVDIIFAHWLAARGGRLWMLPRAERWMRSALPVELRASSLFASAAPVTPDWIADLRQALWQMPMAHDGQPADAQTCPDEDPAPAMMPPDIPRQTAPGPSGVTGPAALET